MFNTFNLFPILEMSNIILDDNNLRMLAPEERLSRCELILKNEKDESLRWDAIWLAGELADGSNTTDLMFNKVADLMVWVLQNDDNGVVKHEACYQIAARNMRNKIPDLIETALHDKSIVARHEAIEALGLMRAFEAEDIIKKSIDDPSRDVKETALFVFKRFRRLKNKGEYQPSKIL